MTHAKPSPRVQRRRAQRTEQILEVAGRLLAEHGPGGLTVHRIAEELDYTVGALYRYFPSKDALIAELERRFIQELRRQIAAATRRAKDAIATTGCDARVAALLQVHVLTRVYAELPEFLPEQFGLVSQNLATSRRVIGEEADQIVMAELMPLLASVVSRLETAVGCGALGAGDPVERALCLWSALQGALQLRKLDRLDPRFVAAIPRLPAGIVHALLIGWGAPASEHAEAVRIADALEEEEPFVTESVMGE